MTAQIAGAVAAVLAGVGGALIYSGWSEGRTEHAPSWLNGRSPHAGSAHRSWSVARQLPDREAYRSAAGRGLRRRAGVPAPQLAGASGMAAIGGALVSYLLFAGWVPTVVGGLFAASFPIAGWRHQRLRQAETDSEAWPRVIEEIRLRTGSLGRSIPAALFEAGRRAPEDWRPVFVAAEREWLLTTDFARTVEILKAGLASPAADVVLETLLMAHEVGGVDLEAWLGDLAEDRAAELETRKDAMTKQAGVRFARSFVLLVPLGMAVAGLSIGPGRSSYTTADGQIAVVVGLLAIVACWVWSGRLMTLPESPRVFGPGAASDRALR